MSDRRVVHPPAIRGAAAIALLVAVAAPLTAGGAGRPRVEVQRLLDTGPLGDSFAFDVRPDGSVILVDGDQVVDGATRRPLLAAPLPQIAWVESGDGEPRLLAGEGLYALSGGTPRLLVEAPLAARVLAVDGVRTYVAGVDRDGRALLFVHEEGKGHRPLLELDEPVDAMVAGRGVLFFSSGQAIWVLRPGQPARRLARLPGLSRVVSLALDPGRATLYFSDGEATYALRGSSFALVHPGLGGMLRWRGDDLHVLSWQDRALFRMRGLGTAMATPGVVASWKDPCLAPVVEKYCQAMAERTLLDAIGDPPGDGPVGTAGVDVAWLARVAAARRESLASIDAALAREAARGVVGVVWTRDGQPRTVGAGAKVETGGRGAILTLWNGSEVQIGPDSRIVLKECRSAGTCRLALERGLLHAQERKAASPEEHSSTGGMSVSAAGLDVSIDGAEISVFAGKDLSALLVLAGQARAHRPGEATQVVSTREMLEWRPGQPPAPPTATDADRVSRWWEDVP